MSIVNGIVNNSIKLLNLIPGVDIKMPTGLTEFAEKIKEARQQARDAMEWEEVVSRKEYVDVSEQAKAGAELGRNVGEKIETGLEGFADSIKLGLTKLETSPTGLEDMPAFGNLENMSFDSNGNLNTSNQTDIKITDEDIKMLHDIAMREVQVNFQQITPQLDVRIDKVEQTTDINEVVEVLTNGISDAMELQLGVPAWQTQ